MLMLSAVAALALGVAGADETGASSPELQRAEALFADYHYEECLSALKGALAANGNGRAALLRIYELQGVSAGQLRRSRLAETAFRQLLILDPSHTLGQEYAPRVTTPFLEAKRLVAEKGSLNFVPQPASVENGQVGALGVKVEDDPLNQARSARFHVRTNGGAWTVTEQSLVAGAATLVTQGASVDWWAELLGDRQAVLEMIGDAGHPLTANAPAPVKLTPEPKPAPPPLVVTASPASSSGSSLRPLAYGLAGAGVISAGVGAYFGYQSKNDLNQINGATVDAQGRVTGLTEKSANQLNDDAKQKGLIANVLFGVGGGLAACGVLFFAIGGSSTEVAAGPAGVTVTGAF